MAQINKVSFCEVILTPLEVEAILKAHLSTCRAGGVVVPESAVFELDEHHARFSWREDRT